MTSRRLGIGFIGSGFITRFHIQSMVGVREADVRGVWSPNGEHADATAALARDLDVGEARSFPSIEAMVSDPQIDAIWLCGPNHARVENVDAICAAVKDGATLRGIACEKPLARTVAEAKQIKAVVDATGLSHGYLENQLFAPSVTRGRELLWRRGAALTGRPYLARAAEEHSGPHMPWFWRGDLQGGGVLNDMMCHSIEVVRHLLTAPGAPRDSIRPRRITGHIASLKWTRPDYSDKLRRTMGDQVDYRAHPAEDFASATVEYETDDGAALLGEASTSWSYVGAGLRLSMELLGPEYSMSVNTLDTGLKLFFSREVRGEAGEDLVEKQNAEVGLMPVVADEVGEYGYTAENRHMARAFLRGTTPDLTFDDGMEVVELLMSAYMSAEQGRTLPFRPDGLDAFVPAVAKGTWTGRSTY
ncbi:MAG: Gfo/Idh/MocA family oxidoreductase [Vicinamibacterales bacterium]|nr:Gfo/Idh/MocA family oxidoreductase [Vicinamibacterales bacterium]MDP7480226.1 Gfo/Idh/MocA family oxidoreductase [Vicinamibacterales bacterium]MDP7690344.1 Gfo/Idh/MocA family oxidoreductase [Vicinamibacterales bacterium]HJN46128.1 Gfo/Idh/MocA family oxidoreductase [Vicinamibacterales bacterium]